MGRRNAALISLLLDSGLRAAEICRLCWKDLDLPHYRLVVVVKGGNQELGHYGPETVERLEAWERDWQKFRNSGVEAVFIALRGWTPGQPLTKKGLQRLLSNLGEAQGIPNVSPHAFRRAFACLLIEQGAPNRLVQAFGRWQNETMVKRYTAGLEASRLYEQYSPTNFLKQVKATE
jgi:integrase